MLMVKSLYHFIFIPDLGRSNQVCWWMLVSILIDPLITQHLAISCKHARSSRSSQIFDHILDKLLRVGSIVKHIYNLMPRYESCELKALEIMSSKHRPSCRPSTKRKQEVCFDPVSRHEVKVKLMIYKQDSSRAWTLTHGGHPSTIEWLQYSSKS